MCDKLAKDEPVLFEDAKELYINNSCRNVINGKPYYYNYWQNKLEEMNDDELKVAVSQFLTMTIGRLVLKGALRIIPQLQLNN